MTGRERILMTLNGGRPDRIPVSLYRVNPFEGDTFWTQHASFRPLLDAAREKTDAFQFHRPETGFFFSAPGTIAVKVEESQDSPISHIVKLTVETDLGLLTRVARMTRVSSTVWIQKPWIESEKDIRKFLSLPYTPFDPDVSGLAAVQAALGERGMAVVALPDPLGVVGPLFAPGDFARFAFECPGLVHDLLEAIYERLKPVYERLSRKIENALVRIRGAEYATPPELSSEHFPDPRKPFSDFCLRYDRELVPIMRADGRTHVCYHWHGEILELLPLALRLGFDAIEPVCNSCETTDTIAKVRRVVGDRITIMGGVAEEDLEFRGAGEIEPMVRDAIRQGGRNARFMLIPSGVPQSAPLSPELSANYIEFMDAGLRYGTFPIR